MKLDLSKLILETSGRRNNAGNTQVERVTKQYTVEPEFTTYSCSYGDYEVISKNPIELNVVNLGNNKVNIFGNVELVLGIPCDRCLKVVPSEICFEMSLDIDLNDEADRTEDAEDYSYVDGRIIDIDGMLYPEIFMNLPTKVLCNKDCKGICRECGKNLNEGECGCDTFVADPRMAAISDIFKNFNNK